MKIVHLSDTHGQHHEFYVGSGNVLIHSGDAELRGPKNVEEFAKWMGSQAFEHKIYVPGNHDRYPAVGEFTSLEIFEEHGVHMLLDDGIEIDGLKFYGMPHTPEFGVWWFMGDKQYMKEKCQLIPMDTDILITHGPLHGILDNPGRGPVGCEMLGFKVTCVRPILHLFGHIHEGYGAQSFMDTLFINSAVCPSFLDVQDKLPHAILLNNRKVMDFYPVEDDSVEFEYKGKKVIQEQMSNGDFVYQCDNQLFYSIYELELYVDPECVASRKKEDIEKRKKSEDVDDNS